MVIKGSLGGGLAPPTRLYCQGVAFRKGHGPILGYYEILRTTWVVRATPGCAMWLLSRNQHQRPLWGKQSGKHGSNLLPGIHIKDLFLGKVVLFATVPHRKLRKHHCQGKKTHKPLFSQWGVCSRKDEQATVMSNTVRESEGTS